MALCNPFCITTGSTPMIPPLLVGRILGICALKPTPLLVWKDRCWPVAPSAWKPTPLLVRKDHCWSGSKGPQGQYPEDFAGTGKAGRQQARRSLREDIALEFSSANYPSFPAHAGSGGLARGRRPWRFELAVAQEVEEAGRGGGRARAGGQAGRQAGTGPGRPAARKN